MGTPPKTEFSRYADGQNWDGRAIVPDVPVQAMQRSSDLLPMSTLAGHRWACGAIYFVYQPYLDLS